MYSEAAEIMLWRTTHAEVTGQSQLSTAAQSIAVHDCNCGHGQGLQEFPLHAEYKKTLRILDRDVWKIGK